MFFWFFGFFFVFLILIGIQLMYYLALIAAPVLMIGGVIWLICKLVRKSKA
ncbi:MAG: hypothetical protein ACRDTG_23665 [Pseudonocardiaceae bacterium]